MGWIKQSEDTRLPAWLNDNLEEICPYCGTEKENYYNEKDECTNRHCPNKSCPQTLAQRIVSIADMFGIAGVGPQTASRMVRANHLINAYEAIPILVKEKPTIPLSMLMRINFIPGIDTRWERECGAYSSVEEMLKNYRGALSNILKTYRDSLLEAETYVNIRKPETQQYETVIEGNVMITGIIPGFKEREMFVQSINSVLKGAVRIGVVGKRKTGVMALIMEEGTKPSGKSEVAKACGIPVMTSDAFLLYLMQELDRRRIK